MQSQLNSILEGNMKLELVEVDCDGMRFGVFRHFFTPEYLTEKTKDFSRIGSN